MYSRISIRINRNIVECKDDIKLWNYSVKRVLIETSWNVKEYDLVTVSDMPSINRNIVECKERTGYRYPC